VLGEVGNMPAAISRFELRATRVGLLVRFYLGINQWRSDERAYADGGDPAVQFAKWNQ